MYLTGPIVADVMSLGNAAAAEAREGPRSLRESGMAGQPAPTGLAPGSDEMRALLMQRQGLLSGRQ